MEPYPQPDMAAVAALPARTQQELLDAIRHSIYARKAVLELAESFDRLARAAATPAVLRRRELATKEHE
jgi:hypothetical protein